MRQKLARWKKVGLIFSVSLVLSIGVLLPLFVGVARAAGETFQYLADSGTITVTGPNVIGTTTLSYSSDDPWGNYKEFTGKITIKGSAARTPTHTGENLTNSRSCIYDISVYINASDLTGSPPRPFPDATALSVNKETYLRNPSDGNDGVQAGECVGDCTFACDDADALVTSPGQIPILNGATIAAQKECTDKGGVYDVAGKKCTLPTCPAVQNVQGIYDTVAKDCAYPASSFPGGKCPPPLTTVGTACHGAATAPTSPNSGDNGEEPDPCPVEKGTAMRWMACPIVSAGEVITNALDATINYFLTIDTTHMFGTATGQNGNIGDPNSPTSLGFYKAWSTFRNLGIALVIIAGLVMVMSEMLGLSIIDAYTVRKTLPRLVIAIIGISISWYLCYYLITFFNKLGHGTSSLIYSAFTGITPNQSGSVATISAFAQYFAIGSGLLALGVLGILSFLGTLILALLVGIAVLILREAIIIMCVIIAPLAIAAYVLPNTSKFASFWWGTFTKALMAFPIITGFIAICKVMSVITGSI